MIRVGEGVVRKEGDGVLYMGSMPFDDKTEVYVIRREDLVEMMKCGLRLLHNSYQEMDEGDLGMFPDEIQMDGHRLFLDRRYYSHDLESYLYVRYASIDRLEKDGEFKGSVPPVKCDPVEDIIVERRRTKDFRKKVRKRLEQEEEKRDGYYFDGFEWYETEEEE